MLTRRSLLLGAVCAPAVVRASSLMPIWVPPQDLFPPIPWMGVDWGTPGGGRRVLQSIINRERRAWTDAMLIQAGRSVGKTQTAGDLLRWRLAQTGAACE